MPWRGRLTSEQGHDERRTAEPMRYDISRRRTLPLGAVLWAALACQCWAAVLYVDDDAPPGGNGSSWQTAFRHLQDALTAAATAEKPLEIRVAQGVYKPDQGVGQTAGDRLASFDLFKWGGPQRRICGCEHARSRRAGYQVV
jgi:hypothetical protein